MLADVFGGYAAFAKHFGGAAGGKDFNLRLRKDLREGDQPHLV